MWMPVEASIEIGYVDDFEALLKAIAAAFPSDAVLYVEGAAFAPEVAGYLPPAVVDTFRSALGGALR